MWNRRKFIKTLGIFGGTIIAPFRPKKQIPSARIQGNTVRFQQELYEGFIILPDGAPMPDYVQCAPAPILCQVDGPEDPAARGVVTRLQSIEELEKLINFPLYVPSSLPSNDSFASTSIIQFAQSGKVFDTSINYSAAKTGELSIKMRARPVYPRPYPVWPVHSPSLHEKEMVAPEKVKFLPRAGLMRPNATGYVLNWIEKDILYTLSAGYGSNRQAVIELASSLSRRQ